MMPSNMEGEKELQPGVPTATAQSWGTLVSIIVIVLMIIVGAFYAWGNRIAEEQQITAPVQ
jgi:hypothetical protein